MTAAYYTHEFLDHPTIAHGFFGRKGGVSEGLYAGLNCGLGSHDNKAHVVENRARVAHALDAAPENLCTLYQIHSPSAVIIHAPWTEPPPQADALVTNVKGLLLGILTADCAPILFADVDAGVVGAAHAGWKGAHSGVVESTVLAMETLGAARANIAATIGPCISQASYEVGPEFIERFEAADQTQFFIKSNREGFYRFDLAAYVAKALRQAGLQRVAMLAMDTASDPETFFSYRRATRNAEPDYGRHISCIGLKI